MCLQSDPPANSGSGAISGPPKITLLWAIRRRKTHKEKRGDERRKEKEESRPFEDNAMDY